jgi:hypothetical protein
MDIGTLKISLADLLGLPTDAILEYEGDVITLSYMAFSEMNTLLSLPQGFVMTNEIRVPDKGEYFLDLASLVDEDRVIIYLATGAVHSANLVLTNEEHSVKQFPGRPKADFDLFKCILTGGQAIYKGDTISIVIPMIDKADCVVVASSDGHFKVVAVSELQNTPNKFPMLDPTRYTLGNKKPPSDYSDRFDLKFDDDEIDPELN